MKHLDDRRAERELLPTSSGGPGAFHDARVDYARGAAPAATMPRGLAPDRVVLLDKLGARLQFERTGTRLYEALLAKRDAYGGYPGGPAPADLRAIRDEEHEHARLVQAVITRLGGDPAVLTPAASLQATACRGIADVLYDPRTSLVECLDAILIAELTDHASWELLGEVALALPDEPVRRAIADAAAREAEHLAKVRRWIAAAEEARHAGP